MAATNTGVIGDFNLDGVVDIRDYVFLINDFNKTGSGLVSDLNQDEVVNIKDFNWMLNQVGKTLVSNQAKYTTNKVILLVWDGTRKERLMALYNEGSLPNLKKLVEEGMLRDAQIDTNTCQPINDEDNYRTETGPGHSAMLTGYGYPLMNNYSNCDCTFTGACSLNPGIMGVFGPNPIPKGYTVFERLKDKIPNIKTGMITGKAYYFFPFPAFENAAPASCNYVPPDACRNGKNPPLLSGKVTEGAAIDDCQAQLADNSTVTGKDLAFLETYKFEPFFLFAQLRDPDYTGHSVQGYNLADYPNDTYDNAIIDDDIRLGQITQKLKDLKIYDETVILVTTDHGFDDQTGSHVKCEAATRDIWIASNKAWTISNLNVNAKQTSITPTIYSIYGIKGSFEPEFSGKSLYHDCSSWSGPIPATSVPGNGDFNALSQYSQKSGTQLVQDIWRGNQKWTRLVPIVNGLPRYDQASGWSGPVAITVLGLPVSGIIQTMAEFNTSKFHFQSVRLSDNSGYVRKVPMVNGVPDWPNASVWVGVPADPQFGGNYQAISHYVQKNGMELVQNIWAGGNLYSRTVPIDVNSGEPAYSAATPWSAPTPLGLSGISGTGEIQGLAEFTINNKILSQSVRRNGEGWSRIVPMVDGVPDFEFCK